MNSETKRPPLPFKFPAAGTPGSEHDATITRMIEQGHSWADIEAVIGEGAFDRYYTMLDPELESIWSLDLIIKLNGVVQRCHINTTSTPCSSLNFNTENISDDIENDDKSIASLPWTKIAESMGQPAGACMHIWRSFGDGRPLDGADRVKLAGMKRKASIAKEAGVARPSLPVSKDGDVYMEFVDTLAFEQTPRRTKRSSLSGPLPTRSTSIPQSRNISSSGKVDGSPASTPSTHVRPTQTYKKTTTTDMPNLAKSEDETTRSGRTRLRGQMHKLVATRVMINQLAIKKEEDMEQRQRELDGFMQSRAEFKQLDQIWKQRHQRATEVTIVESPSPAIIRQSTVLVDEPQIRRHDWEQESRHPAKAPKANEQQSIIVIDLTSDDDADPAPNPEPNQHQRRCQHQYQGSAPQPGCRSPVLPNTNPHYDVLGWTEDDIDKTWSSWLQVGDNWEFISTQILKGRHSPHACRAFVMGQGIMGQGIV
ncbi:hypothetical protein B0O80DRAFT_238783 [Mortierella sp. GBAus27b]|nr:hypothetical protein B0O80DRAFT_238783 [Mortierella sp. GBAus27b]